MDTYSSRDETIYSSFGLVGCLLISVAQVPNIVRVYKRKQSMDISYAYQIVLSTGIVFFIFYYAYFDSVLVYPTALSLLFTLSFVGLKYYIEEVYTPLSQMMVSEYTTNDHDEHFGHSLLPQDAERSDDSGNTGGDRSTSDNAQML